MKHLGALLISMVAVTACGDDDNLLPDDDANPTLDRDFTLRIENVAPWTVLKASTQATKTDLIDGPLAPTEAFEVRFSAGPGHHLSFATMLGESNDWFFAPDPEGIPLYSIDGVPLSGDITNLVRLWDAGTEFDQEPAVGDATGTKQATRNFGEPDPDANVREVPVSVSLGDGSTFVRPATAEMIKVTLTPGPDRGFVLRIENVSTETTLVTSEGTLPVHVSPMTWTVHRTAGPIFEPGKPARENGLESLAESGAPDSLGTALRFSRGVATPLSPGVFVVHTAAAPLFTPGLADRELGLERLAEDGNPIPISQAIPGSVAFGVEAAMPGGTFEVTFHAAPGDHVSFATMFAMSNDWIFATVPAGIALFDGDIPRSCDVTAEVALFDLGTENDEELDVGENVGTQQAAPDSGKDDRIALVREVTLERYEEPEVLHIRVTLIPN